MELALDGLRIPSLIAKLIQQALGELHNVLTKSIQDLSTTMDYY
jgi:hypothetical protein